ncbi:MAG: hypothetical protein JST87_04760 [Bacteroidetes bacterium]|nr:hypothetical protein [Bacteroidota bacterium]
MKKIFCLIMLFANVHGYAQGLSNFFSQKEADIKYMLAQIADLDIYISEAEKGYDIAKKGLTIIGELKKGEFDLHNTFFTSLKNVNPAITNYSKVADIISYEISIVGSFKKILQLKNISVSEINYLQKVYANMSIECSKALSVLLGIITIGTFEMADNERMHRIDLLYEDMKDKNAFVQSFYSDALMLSIQRQNELSENELLKKLY